MIPIGFQKFGFIFGVCVICFWIVHFFKVIKYTPSENQANSKFKKILIAWVLKPKNAPTVIALQFIVILILILSCMFMLFKTNDFEMMERELVLQKADIDFYEGILVNLQARMSDFEQQAIESKIPIDSIKSSSDNIRMNSRLLLFDNGKLTHSIP